MQTDRQMSCETGGQTPWVKHCHAPIRLQEKNSSIPVLQFEMECRPFYVSGFNAHDLVPKFLATPADHNTVGWFCSALPP